MKNIVLIGLMGSGKTMISKRLAQQLHVERFSTDEMIEAEEQMPIAKIVEDKGWPYFRRLEQRIVQTLSERKSIVIDCGGGVVLDPSNIMHLKKNGLIFHLHAPPAILFNRLKNDQTRPLINGPDPQARLKELYEERLPLYNQADFVIDASDASIAGPIVEILKKVS